MRNAALVLGVICGLLAMLIGFFIYGYAELSSHWEEVGEAFGHLDDADTVRLASFLAPLMAIAGGAMAHARALIGGLLMLGACGLIFHAFGFGVFTMFPIGFCALGGVLALAAGRPDEPKSHF